jgi:hypothetical protein
MKREFNKFVEEVLSESAVKLFVARDFKTKQWVVKWMEEGDFKREKFQYFPTEEKAQAFKERMKKNHAGLFEKEGGIIKRIFSRKKKPISKERAEKLKLKRIHPNLKEEDKDKKIRMMSMNQYRNIQEGGKCTGPTKKASSTSKGKKWMKCVKQPDGKYKRVHWGQKGVKVTGKSGNTKRKKSFRARHNCSNAKKGSAQAQACKDW